MDTEFRQLQQGILKGETKIHNSIEKLSRDMPERDARLEAQQTTYDKYAKVSPTRKPISLRQRVVLLVKYYTCKGCSAVSFVFCFSLRSTYFPAYPSGISCIDSSTNPVTDVLDRITSVYYYPPVLELISDAHTTTNCLLL